MTAALIVRPARFGALSALELSTLLERSLRDDRVRIVVCRAAELGAPGRVAWARWAVWLAAAITLSQCGLKTEVLSRG